MRYLGFPVSAYEGGGFSESKKNRALDREEHRRITENYMGRGELFRYRFIMLCTLAPLRSKAAENKALSGVYHRMKEKIYRRGN